jgi:hypothetical protein
MATRAIMHAMADLQTQGAPLAYPKFPINGELIEVKLRGYDIIQLSKEGVSLSKVDADLGPSLDRAFKILHHGIAHAFEERIDQWPSAETLSKMDLGDAGFVVKTVNDSLSLAMAQWKTHFPDLNQPKPENPPTVQ